MWLIFSISDIFTKDNVITDTALFRKRSIKMALSYEIETIRN